MANDLLQLLAGAGAIGGSMAPIAPPTKTSSPDEAKGPGGVVYDLAQYPPKKGKTASKTTNETFDLGQALGPQMSGLAAQLQQALGLPTGGMPTEGQYANAASPGLSQYLTGIQHGLQLMGGQAAATGGGGLAQVLQQGLAGVGQAESTMPGAITAMGANLGQSGLLQDLLNAARYQAIYKQAGYGQPPKAGQAGYDPTLSNLYNTVVGGGNALSGGLPAAVTQPKSAGTSIINPGSSPFGQ